VRNWFSVGGLLVMKAACKSNRSCDDNRASQKDTHWKSPVICRFSSIEYKGFPRERRDILDTQNSKIEPILSTEARPKPNP
jgi:hypothetical protein